MSETAWGIIFIAYVALALPIMGMGNGDAPRPTGLPGSSNVARYEAREKRWRTFAIAWAVGLVALCIVWAYS